MLNMFKDRKFYLFLLVTLAFFGCLFAFEYATDSYVVALDVKGYTQYPLDGGRFITALFFFTFGSISNSIYPPYYFSLVLGIVILPIVIYRIYLLVKDHLSEKFAILFSILLIINPFFIEYFLFLETGFFILCILFVVLSFEQFNKAIDGDYKRLIFAVLFGIIASFIYQSLVSLLAVFMIFAIAFKVKNIKPFIVNTLIAIGVYVCSVLPCFLAVKLFSSSTRVGSFNLSNIAKILMAGGPVVGVLMILLIVGLIFALAALKNKFKNDERSYWVYVAIYAYLFAGAIAVTVGPYIFVDPASAVPSYRTLYPLIVLVLLFVYEFAYQKEVINKDKRWQCVTLLSVLICEFALFETVFIGRFINNAEDEKEIRLIQQAIDDYESTSGNVVTSLSFYKDSDSHFSHKGAICLGINLKAFMTDWSDIASVNVILGTNYEKVDNDQTVYDINFKDYKSDSFDIDNQLVFIDNTLHIYVY